MIGIVRFCHNNYIMTGNFQIYRVKKSVVYVLDTCNGCDDPSGFYESDGTTNVCSATDACICSEGMYGPKCDKHRCKY